MNDFNDLKLDYPVIPFVDIETTGLDNRKDELLQVAIVITDSRLNTECHLNWYVKQDPSVKDKADEKVVAMHEATGLWDKVSSEAAITIEELDEILYRLFSFIKGDSSWPVKIAGNSVRFDRDFLVAKLPKTAALLSHQVIDISSVLGFFRAIDRRIKLEKVERDHDAMNDVLDCIRQARAIREQVSVAVV